MSTSSSSVPIPSEGEPVFLTASNWGIVVPSGTGSTTITPLWTNFPGASSGSQNAYTWFKLYAADGTAVYVPAWR